MAGPPLADHLSRQQARHASMPWQRMEKYVQMHLLSGYETLQLQNRWFHEASVDRIMASSAHPSLYLDELVKALRAPRAVMPTRDAATKALGLCSGVASLLLEPAHAPADTEVLQKSLFRLVIDLLYGRLLFASNL